MNLVAVARRLRGGQPVLEFLELLGDRPDGLLRLGVMVIGLPAVRELFPGTFGKQSLGIAL